MRSILRLTLCWLAWGVGTRALAHDAGLSTAQGELRSEALVLSTSFAPTDLRPLLGAPETLSAKWTAAEFEAAKPRLLTLAPQLWEIRGGASVIEPREIHLELLTADDVRFQFLFPLPEPEQSVTLRANSLARLPPGHRQLLIVTAGGGQTLGEKLLSADSPTLVVSVRAADGAIRGEADKPRFWGFLKLGVEHIWTGYDHLVFLFALLVVCRTFRSIVAIISCFTLAHSLTLALATLDVVELSPRWVEPAIAASIVFVGLENLWSRGVEPRGRLALTFGFGLIHGFGFASVLRDLGVGGGGRGIAVPLFSFNLGVELGQVVVAALVLPVVWRLRRNARFVKRGVPILSAIVALVGLYWFFERTLFS